MCFNVYLGFVLIRYGNMTDMVTIALKKDFITDNSPENGAWHAMPEPCGEGMDRKQKAQGKA